MKRIQKVLTSTRGSIIFEASAMLILVVMVLALALHTFPVFIAKQQLDTYASELCRTAELAGEIGAETTDKEEKLDGTFTLTCTIQKDIGFANFGSFPVTLKAVQEGRSEVYWK